MKKYYLGLYPLLLYIIFIFSIKKNNLQLKIIYSEDIFLKNFIITAPLNIFSYIPELVKHSNIKNFHFCYNILTSADFSEIKTYTSIIHKLNCKVYVTFKQNFTREYTKRIKILKKNLLFLTYCEIDGIFIDDFYLLQAITDMDLPFDIILGSQFNIHNLKTVELLQSFKQIKKFVITQELNPLYLNYIKDQSETEIIFKHQDIYYKPQKIFEDNFIETLSSKNIENYKNLIINKFENLKTIDNKNLFKGKFFQNQENNILQINHFQRNITDISGEIIPFKGHINRFSYQYQNMIPANNKSIRLKNSKLPKINLKLRSLTQIKALEQYIKSSGFNPIYSVEYGELAAPSDLSEKNITELIAEVQNFCHKHNIKFQYSTPEILTERDFERVYNDTKSICIKKAPDSIIINNLGFFYKLSKDKELNSIPVEIGAKIPLLNDFTIKNLNKFLKITTVDFSSIKNLTKVKEYIQNTKKIILNRKYTVGGNISIPSTGLCPLNDNPPTFSRLNCEAKCKTGIFSIENGTKIYPFITDGFCRAHFFENKISTEYKNIKIYEGIGINEFVLDITAINDEFIPTIMNNFLDSININYD